jgi:hypothetical protein
MEENHVNTPGENISGKGNKYKHLEYTGTPRKPAQ